MATFVLLVVPSAALVLAPSAAPPAPRGARGISQRGRCCVRLSAPGLDASQLAGLETFLASDEMQAALRDDDDLEEEEEEGLDFAGLDFAAPVQPAQSELAPAHARPIAELDESVFVARAWKEEAFLSPGESVLRPIAGLTAESAAAALTSSGIGRLDGVLSAATVDGLRGFVLSQLEEAERVAAEDGGGVPTDDEALDEAFRLVVVGSGTQRLSDERGRLALSSALGDALGDGGTVAADDGANRRWDLRLPSSAPAVRRALCELLAPGAAFGGALDLLAGGDDAEMWELAAIVSAPGAAPQVVHADTVWQPRPLLFTAFIALQEIVREMGPTRFLPGTHDTSGPTEALARAGDATGLASAPGAPPPSRVGVLGPGDAAFYDGRLLHCGGANKSAKLRVLFYATFRAASASGRDVSGDGLDAASSESSVTLGELRADLFGADPDHAAAQAFEL